MLYSFKERFSGWTILVVDDEPDSLEVATRWLKVAGANVVTATDGREGLSVARAERPQLIISDLTMPTMDGWEMLYELRQDEDTSQIPVIALTAHAMKGTRERAVQAGFVAHVSKPINPSRFLEQVLKIVREVSVLTAGAPAG